MVNLEIYYSRFGVLIRPYSPLYGFDYNRVYFSVEDVLKDFSLNGWEVVGEPEKSKEPNSGSFYRFEPRSQP